MIEGFEMLKRIIFLLLLSCLIASVVAPVFAARGNVDEGLVTERLETRLTDDTLPDGSEVDSPEPVIINSVTIRNIPNASTVMSLVPIIAKSSSILYNLYYQIDGGVSRLMTRVTSFIYRVTWNSTASTTGWHQLNVYAKNILGVRVASTHVHVYVTRTYKYALYYEIDYMSGHYPPASVRTYMQNYWKAFAIQVTFKVDDIVTDPTPSDGKITDSDFWKIEHNYNDVWKYDDRAHGSSATGKYTLREKWMLYGTWATSSTTGGYCYIIRSGSDVLAGNYIFIADSMIDNWEAAYAVPYEGGEEIVVCHEAGHSIGICKLSATYKEVYDSDYYSVMSNMRMQNAKYMARYWYYSKEYWATANLSYYRIYILPQATNPSGTIVVLENNLP
jgi:hypothetical protein